MSDASDPVIGIDLGTTNSLVAISDARGPRIIEGPGGQRILPSVVYIDPVTGQATVGRDARAHAVERPTETVYSIKRLMGRGMADVQEELAHLPYRVVAHGDSADAMAEVDIAGRRYTPQQISAMILAELKRWAEARLGQAVSKAVITVPAYFDDAQRQATRDAGRIAGIEVLRIVNEPTAAALAYGLDRAADETVAVYDLGGGTFDISILRIEKGVFRVLSTNGDTHLGGDDFDRAIIDLVQREIREQFGATIQFDPSTQQALRNFAESVKIQLSEKDAAEIEIDLGEATDEGTKARRHGGTKGGQGEEGASGEQLDAQSKIENRKSKISSANPQSAIRNPQSQPPETRIYRRTLTQREFLSLIDPLIQRSLDRCAIALRDAGKTPRDIDRVVMVGGSTYMPHIRMRVGGFFQSPVYTALNPMEVVALGAAVQAGIIGGVKRDVLLLDIIPLSLGIETMGGAVAKLITKGTHIPCVAKDLFSTFVDGQTSVKIHVLQGERELVKDCRSLGQFILSDIPPMPAGIPKVRVTFLVDANGILNVLAMEERTARAASIQIVPSYGLTRDEVTQMVRESVAHARDDMLEHRLIDLRNQIALDTAAIEKSLGVVGDEIDPKYRKELLEIIEGLRGMATWRDADAIYNALRYLDKKSASLAELAIAKTLREKI